MTSSSCEKCIFCDSDDCNVPGKVCVHRKIEGTNQTVGDIMWRLSDKIDLVKYMRSKTTKE